MQTLVYSIMHFLTDGACACAMFAYFYGAPDFYLWLLLYNFSAFVLQFPIGALMDFIALRQQQWKKYSQADLPLLCTFLSILFLAAGMFTHPIVLGIGNALFHVGGGIGVIKEDRRKSLRGQALGIFVAPGALGLFLFTTLGKQLYTAYPMVALVMLLMLFAAFSLQFMIVRKQPAIDDASRTSAALPPHDRNTGRPKLLLSCSAALAVLLAFLVVVLRSYTGFAVRFAWKNDFLFGLLATLALVLGKAAGGIASAHFGTGKTILVSLLAAVLLYFFGDVPAAGIAALFFFNMTMPVTLYLVTERFPKYPGASFGLLTVALFLGFLPQYLQLPALPAGRFTGTVLALVSLALLFTAFLILKREEKRHALSH